MSTKTMVITLQVRDVPGGRDPATLRRDVADAVASQLVPRLPITGWTAEERGAGTFARCELLEPPERYNPALCEKACEDAGYYVAAFRATNVPGEVLTLIEQANEQVDVLSMLANDASLPMDLRHRLAVMRDDLRQEIRVARAAHCGDE